MRPNSKLIKTTLSGALGGLIFGYDLALVAGILDSVVRLYRLSASDLGLTVAMCPIGTILGCFAAGILGQRLGPRAALHYASGLYILAVAATACSVSWPMLLTTRFIAGIGLGAVSVLGPVYITELAPAEWRGRLVGAFQINVVVGVLLGYTANYLVRLAHLGALEWRAIVVVASLPALLFFVLLFRIPRSPRWLVARHHTQEALGVLAEMGAADPATELATIQSALHAEDAAVDETVFRWKYRYPLFLAISIGAFNQLSGFGAILCYVHTIFAAAGFSQLSGDVQALFIGATNLVFTLAGMALIDHLGRKRLLIFGAIGSFACLAGVAWVFNSNSHQAALLGLLVAFVGFFALSQGAVIWVYIGEVFPTSVRSKGQGVGGASYWITNTIVSLAFPVLISHINPGAPFVLFATATLLQLLVVVLFYPETKGHTLEELQHKLLRVE